METTTDFTCRQCGACCRWQGHVLLTSRDISAISAALGISEDDFIQAHTVISANRTRLSLTENSDGSCSFLAADNHCLIYNARPQQCREFPHTWRVEGCPALAATPQTPAT